MKSTIKNNDFSKHLCTVHEHDNTLINKLIEKYRAKMAAFFGKQETETRHAAVTWPRWGDAALRDPIK